MALRDQDFREMGKAFEEARKEEIKLVGMVNAMSEERVSEIEPVVLQRKEVRHFANLFNGDFYTQSGNVKTWVPERYARSHESAALTTELRARP